MDDRLLQQLLHSDIPVFPNDIMNQVWGNVNMYNGPPSGPDGVVHGNQQPPQPNDEIIDLTEEPTAVQFPNIMPQENLYQLHQLGQLNQQYPTYISDEQFRFQMQTLNQFMAPQLPTYVEPPGVKRKLDSVPENVVKRRKDANGANASKREASSSLTKTASSDDVIDLTDVTEVEDEELKRKTQEEMERRQKKKEHHYNQLVCYGVLTTLVVELNVEKYNAALEGLRESKVDLIPERSLLHAGTYDVKVVARTGEAIGYMEKKVASTLSPFLDRLRIDAYINKTHQSKYTTALYLTMFGTRSMGAELGDTLRQNRLTLGPTFKPSAVPYENPHQNVTYASRSFTTVSNDSNAADMKSQIDSIYNALTAAEDLPELEPDLRLITNMYKHQKQALHFMTLKERRVDFKKFDPSVSLWKYEAGGYKHVITNQKTSEMPLQMKGGILADDMGLGKTIEVISLLSKEVATAEFLNTKDREHLSCGTLIICPLSTDIVLTTYSVLSTEFSKDIKSGNANADSPNESLWTSSLMRIRWFRVVLDEAHIIKDPNTAQAKAACSISADRKWCLTGTPIQNRLDARFASNPIGVHRLQTLMKSITLRRTKNQKIDGKPILSLPERVDNMITINLSPSEQGLYDRLHLRAKEIFHGLQASGTVMKHYVHLLEIILRLRQVCVHPLLCKETDLEFKNIGMESGAGKRAQAIHLLSLLRESGDDKCSNCEVPVETLSNDGRAVSIALCGHIFCNECLASMAPAGGPVACPSCGNSLETGQLFELKDLDGDEEDDLGAPKPLDSQSTLDMRYSSKVIALIQNLVSVREKAMLDGEVCPKSVVFSQWTNLLDLISPALVEAGFTFSRVDGKMNRNERSNAINRFKQEPECQILLLSLKAGGVGLNLTAANWVYIMEPYWNPAVEQQAIDRVHRMGQTRVVNTVRFISHGTIENNIIELQKRKMRLAEMAFEKREVDEDDDGLGKKGQKRAKARENKEEMARQRMLDLNLLFQ
ncbi:hypothetical protein HDU97_005365 [Phlyctochytrium planicorne]|nr:hypothetical protein HDU97_005365 [Phlyctochytrium planicorne]